ncbi:glycine--tRNA ligase subunit beta [Thiohalocapsa sp. ML1]|uniref:glycine--tRNA ligase subunit beta n=1 Tax=Thiohalocapsa sp. ML1 TaxID=1431688 RepID=UPI0007320262|nr:glycine--tRNA ligase subunit beta [Thiohalocapsa sp. ML1]
MPEVQDLLVEIGTEELPPRALLGLSEAFASALAGQLLAVGLSHGTIAQFATPRRLGLLVRNLATHQREAETVRRGPAVSAAFDAEGAPTKAAMGFAKSCGVTVEDLERDESEKGAWLVHRQVQSGSATPSLLPEVITAALERLPIAKRMRWGDGEVSFVRPVHWACVVFGTNVVPGSILGVAIGQDSRGHRFHHPGPLPVETPEQYAPTLRKASVEPDFSLRRERVRAQVSELARSVQGKAHMPPELLDEVTALCEWPVALLGRFDEDFLSVPPEVLIETMQQHQKYFPVRGADDDALLPYFIAVANIDSREPRLVRAGNERVIRPRFSDARFFWDQDLRVSLAARAPALEQLVFQHKLGSVGDKSRRVAAASRRIATLLGYDADAAERAAQLAKCDLVTSMVGEFPGLQGTMGRRYAERAGEDSCVAAALEEQYMPRHAGDQLPAGPCGRVLALADKLDTLIGIFAIGERPSGVKDPYGLRRAAIGVLRILIETPLPLDLRKLISDAAADLPETLGASEAVDDTYAYIVERLRGYYADQGINASVVDAVLAVEPAAPSDIDKRVRAVAGFAELEAAAALAAANKRIANIFKKAEVAAQPGDIDPTLFEFPAEQALAATLAAVRRRVVPLLEKADYAAALNELALLRGDVDAYFDAVLVMDKDPRVRRNRLALLSQIGSLFASIADISKLRFA